MDRGNSFSGVLKFLMVVIILLSIFYLLYQPSGFLSNFIASFRRTMFFTNLFLLNSIMSIATINSIEDCDYRIKTFITLGFMPSLFVSFISLISPILLAIVAIIFAMVIFLPIIIIQNMLSDDELSEIKKHWLAMSLYLPIAGSMAYFMFGKREIELEREYEISQEKKKTNKQIEEIKPIFKDEQKW